MKLHQLAWSAAAIVTTLVFLLCAERPQAWGRVCYVKARKIGELSNNWFIVCPVLKLLKSFINWICLKRFCLIPLVIGLVPWILHGVFSLIALIFIVVPFAGYSLAEKNFQEWVINADYCKPIATKQERQLIEESLGIKGEKPTVTSCLELWRDGVLVRKGRHVVSTNTHVILFDPDSGRVWREPIGDVSRRPSELTVTELNAKINELKHQPEQQQTVE